MTLHYLSLDTPRSADYKQQRPAMPVFLSAARSEERNGA